MLQGNFEELLYPFDTPGARFTRADVPPIMCATIPHLTPDHDAFFDEIEPAVRSLPTQSPSQQYRDIFDWLCSRFGRVAWVERSGTSLMSASVLLKHFPDARVIHVYRDGRDVALSMSRHYLFRVLVASLTGLRMGSVDMLNLIRHDWIWEHLESGISYNPLSREGIQDPYPIYDRLREKDPVHRLRLTNAWILTRYEDVNRVMRDHGQFPGMTPMRFPSLAARDTRACSAWTRPTTPGSGHWFPRLSRPGLSPTWARRSRPSWTITWTGSLASANSTC